MTTASVQFTVGDEYYSRAHFDWHEITTYTVMSRIDDRVTVRDQYGFTYDEIARVTTTHDGQTVEALDLGIYKYSPTIYSHMTTSTLGASQ